MKITPPLTTLEANAIKYSMLLKTARYSPPCDCPVCAALSDRDVPLDADGNDLITAAVKDAGKYRQIAAAHHGELPCDSTGCKLVAIRGDPVNDGQAGM